MIIYLRDLTSLLRQLSTASSLLQTIGVNQRFIPTHSLVVAQQIPNQIKQFSVSPSSIQFPIQNHNITSLTQIPRLTAANICPKQEIVVNHVINSSLVDGSINQTGSGDKSNSLGDMSSTIVNAVQVDSKFQNSVSSINYKRLLELAQGLDPLLQLDDDMQEVIFGFVWRL